MSLVESVGREYMDQFYKGAFFRLDNDLLYYRGHLDEATLCVQKTSLLGVPNWSTVNIKSSRVKDMSAFAWPKLGYREFSFGKNGVMKGAFWVTTQRSAMRGLQDRHVHMNAVPQIEAYGNYSSPKLWMRPQTYMPVLFAPTFTTFGVGMEELKTGKAAAFALNEDFAVAISTSQSEAVLYDVMYKGDIVGEVLITGEVVIPRKMALRSFVQSLFEGRVRV